MHIHPPKPFQPSASTLSVSAFRRSAGSPVNDGKRSVFILTSPIRDGQTMTPQTRSTSHPLQTAGRPAVRGRSVPSLHTSQCQTTSARSSVPLYADRHSLPRSPECSRCKSNQVPPKGYQEPGFLIFSVSSSQTAVMTAITIRIYPRVFITDVKINEILVFPL